MRTDWACPADADRTWSCDKERLCPLQSESGPRLTASKGQLSCSYRWLNLDNNLNELGSRFFFQILEVGFQGE